MGRGPATREGRVANEAVSGGIETRLIAFFLTQFHPIPENDAWSGKGFTEWTNVTKARPLFPGHYQPHLPADLGFYDLRLRAARREQIALAKQYGIDGFCYHYYWFSGRRVLEQPLNDMLADSESDMPFCVCWANENWSRRWDAAEHEVLLSQDYGPDDALRFITELAPILRDPRYIRHNGAPLLIVYRPQHMPDARSAADIWRRYCRESGIGEINLCAALTHGNWDYKQFGFDSGVEFPPHNMVTTLPADQVAFYKAFQGLVVDYQQVANLYLGRDYSAQNAGFRTVFPSWDNTARRKDAAVVILNGTPANYEYWLSQAILRSERDFPDRDRLVFINAWNEWAEGCHLEPDRKYGRQFLDATLRAKRGETSFESFPDTGIPPEARAEPVRRRPRSLAERVLRKLPVIGPARKGKDRRKELKRRARKFHEWSIRLQAEIDGLKLSQAQEHKKLAEMSSAVASLNERNARLTLDLERASSDAVLLRRDRELAREKLAAQIRLAEALRQEIAQSARTDALTAKPVAAAEAERLRHLYLSLLQECLIGGIYRDPSIEVHGRKGFIESMRDIGYDWPSMSFSMIGRMRMANLRQLCETTIREGIAGDFVETGVWRGGACILMRAILEAHGVRDRRVWAADSFDGLPPPDAENYPMDKGLDLHLYRELAVPLETVQDNFRSFGLLDEQVVFLKGWFKDTLPQAPIDRVAVLRLDGDLYESTMDGLRALYRKVSPGGYVIVDDYYTFDACAQAVADFGRAEGFTPRIEEIDGNGVYWRKT